MHNNQRDVTMFTPESQNLPPVRLCLWYIVCVFGMGEDRQSIFGTLIKHGNHPRGCGHGHVTLLPDSYVMHHLIVLLRIFVLYVIH